MIVAGDIGGTKTLLALFDWRDARVEPVWEERYWSADYASFEDVLNEFLEEYAREASGQQEQDEHEDTAGVERESGHSAIKGEADAEKPDVTRLPPITAACFGVAGPIIDNVCRTTNLPWVIEGDRLASRFQIPRVRLLNDLEATAHGLLLLRDDELEAINPAASVPRPGTRALVAAGTGLGEAILFWDGERHLICPSEGGHTDFAPNSDDEIELLRYLRASYLHVSYERVLSGPGLYSIYQFLRDTKKNEPTWFAEKLPTGDPAVLITEAALSGKPDICVQAMSLFVSIYGAEAGNLALKTLARGGVYLGGGIAPKILPLLKDGAFLRAFTAKGRYKRLLNAIPVHVILNPKTALLGAAAVAAQLCQTE
ncbi:MAG: glucokinase [Nitrospirae bacterium]|nr:MAG: glucokinase [Nitrospirota bacterium]